MLFGEHSVVYGHWCLVTAVDQRISVRVDFNGENTLLINAPQLGIKNYRQSIDNLGSREMPKEVSFIESSVKKFYEAFGLKRGLMITTHSEFSHTYGFGSSSGITIATIKALGLLHKIKISEKRLFDLSYQAVLAIQGVGSGFDLAAGLWGGTLFYKKGAKVVRSLGVRHLPLVVCYSGVKADTPTLVRQVAEYKRKHPKKVNKIFEKIDKITIKAKRCLLLKKWPELGELMIKNQTLLQELGVSTIRLEKLIRAALTAGAFGAKLSGAGGGDNIIVAYPAQKRKAIEEALIKEGGQIMKVGLNAKGVLWKKT